MRTHTCLVGLIATLGLLGASCGGGGEVETGPAPGSAEWYWAAAEENVVAGDFGKAAEHLENIEADSEIHRQAVLWRATLLDGLARGYTDVAEAYRLGIKEKPDVASYYQNHLQQAHRDGRQYAIELAEYLGDVEEAIGETGKVDLDFPFPSGGASASPVLASVESGDKVPEARLASATDHSIRRGVILAAAELAGFEDQANQASGQFSSSGVTRTADELRMTMAKILLDRSLLFDRLRLNQPDVRKILIDRAEAWSQPFLEAEDEELRERAEAFQAEIEDERRDMARKARKLSVRG